MPDVRPRPRPLLVQRRQALRVTSATAAAFAAGYLVCELISGTEVLVWLVRAAASVAAVTLVVSMVGDRLARQIDQAVDDHQHRLGVIEERLNARLHRAEFAEGYVRGIQRRPPDDDDGPRLRSV